MEKIINGWKYEIIKEKRYTYIIKSTTFNLDCTFECLKIEYNNDFVAVKNRLRTILKDRISIINE